MRNSNIRPDPDQKVTQLRDISRARSQKQLGVNSAVSHGNISLVFKAKQLNIVVSNNTANKPESYNGSS